MSILKALPLAALFAAAGLFAPAAATAAPRSPIALAPDHVGVVQVHYVGRRHKHRYYREDYDDDVIVDAPTTYVETRGRRTWVDAPFTAVRVHPRGVWVRAPFVNIYIPRR